MLNVWYGVFQMEVERDDATATVFTHVLGDGVFFFDNPNVRDRLGENLPCSGVLPDGTFVVCNGANPDGTVEDLPAAPPKEEIVAAVARLLGKYPAERVAVYLHAFRDMDSAIQWPDLDEILAEEPRLKL